MLSSYFFLFTACLCLQGILSFPNDPVDGVQNVADDDKPSIDNEVSKIEKLEQQLHLLEQEVLALKGRTDKLEGDSEKKVTRKVSPTVHVEYPADCLAILMQANTSVPSGPQHVNIGRRELPLIKNVYCDMETDGGGWTVIQRRFDGSINFNRDYDIYAKGFGLNFHEFWIGNDNLHLMTSRINYELRVELENYDGQKGHATYSEFRIESGCDGYRIHVDGYSGNIGDSMTGGSYSINGMRFSAKDRDQDNHSGDCAAMRQGAWWYNACGSSNLNGLYQTPGSIGSTGMWWWYWFSSELSLKSTEMKIRPALPFCPA